MSETTEHLIDEVLKVIDASRDQARRIVETVQSDLDARIRPALVERTVEPVAWRLVGTEGQTIAWYSTEEAAESERRTYWPHASVEELYAAPVSTPLAAEVTVENMDDLKDRLEVHASYLRRGGMFMRETTAALCDEAAAALAAKEQQP